MPDDDDLEPRVSALERDLAEVRDQVGLAANDAGAARILASGADRDVSEVRAELRAHLRAINALGEAQRETRAALTGRMNSLEAEMRAGFARVETGFATMQAGMTQIVGLLGGEESPER